jgi:DnaK suppressor protein
MTGAGSRQADLKTMLERRRRTLMSGVVQDVREASEDRKLMRAGEVRDSGDEGEAMLQDAVRFAVIDMKAELAARIDAALRRLADGSYGLCEDCGDEIAAARLGAMPFAERCRDCEELREDGERQRRRRPRVRNWGGAQPVNG